MKKTIKKIVDIIMVVALIASICLAAYLLLGQNNIDTQNGSDNINYQGNSTVVKRRSSSN